MKCVVSEGIKELPSAMELPVFADGARSAPATIVRKMGCIKREPSGTAEPEIARWSVRIDSTNLFV